MQIKTVVTRSLYVNGPERDRRINAAFEEGYVLTETHVMGSERLTLVDTLIKDDSGKGDFESHMGYKV